MAFHGLSTFSSLKSRRLRDGERSAFSTPTGAQLNLYLNGLAIFGTPPQ